MNYYTRYFLVQAGTPDADTIRPQAEAAFYEVWPDNEFSVAYNDDRTQALAKVCSKDPIAFEHPIIIDQWGLDEHQAKRAMLQEDPTWYNFFFEPAIEEV